MSGTTRKEQIEAEIRGLDQLIRANDYIGVKIAMGRATKEDYAEQIAESEKMAEKINELRAELEKMDAE